MTKLTLEQQELLFANDCKLINLRYEYHGYTGTEKWAIVTELAEEELWVKYPDVIRRYTPFILLSMAQGEVIDESYRNNDKYEKRAKRTIDVYGYEDDISEQFHRELITPFVDPFEQAEEERIEEEKEQLDTPFGVLNILLHITNIYLSAECILLCKEIKEHRLKFLDILGDLPYRIKYQFFQHGVTDKMDGAGASVFFVL